MVDDFFRGPQSVGIFQMGGSGECCLCRQAPEFPQLLTQPDLLPRKKNLLSWKMRVYPKKNCIAPSHSCSLSCLSDDKEEFLIYVWFNNTIYYSIYACSHNSIRILMKCFLLASYFDNQKAKRAKDLECLF